MWDFTLGEILLIGKEADEQRQIDRACAAQSPDMLPKQEPDLAKVVEAKKRIARQKAGYTHKPEF